MFFLYIYEISKKHLRLSSHNWAKPGGQLMNNQSLLKALNLFQVPVRIWHFLADSRKVNDRLSVRRLKVKRNWMSSIVGGRCRNSMNTMYVQLRSAYRLYGVVQEQFLGNKGSLGYTNWKAGSIPCSTWIYCMLCTLREVYEPCHLVTELIHRQKESRALCRSFGERLL